MKNLLTIIFTILLSQLSFAQNTSLQSSFNLDFEKKTPGQKLPEKWQEWGTGYQLSTDSVEKYSGKNSILIKAPVEKANIPFGCAANTIPAIYEGKEIELRGYMKFENVESGWAGLMLRIDGNTGPLQFSNMQNDNIHGTQDWKQYSIKLPYPGNAAKIHIGALLTGTGKLWVDELELFIDGKPYWLNLSPNFFTPTKRLITNWRL
ncbi:hypothetical protein [Dyadobacter pollutisoli]|uniref:Uncharacterized protein n=1 Tax=Dyadobacter pollutisoli TaxID=2910158 RepID=A0A9E8SMC5_9BACT|nr:hypothetical protein [Dyadobacter pollutisoli]WAC12631.1 hypothetical protein ON006_01440 [Dyadobacter pollutisoli]